MPKFDARKETMIHDGWLRKEGGPLKLKKRRYAKLSVQNDSKMALLRYYARMVDLIPKGCLLVTGSTVSSKGKNSFTIRPRKPAPGVSKGIRTYLMECESAARRAEWFEKLLDCGAAGPAMDALKIGRMGKQVLNQSIQSQQAYLQTQVPQQQQQMQRQQQIHRQPIFRQPQRQQQQQQRSTVYSPMMPRQPVIYTQPRAPQPHYTPPPAFNTSAAPVAPQGIRLAVDPRYRGRVNINNHIQPPAFTSNSYTVPQQQQQYATYAPPPVQPQYAAPAPQYAAPPPHYI
jgi:hypothetical protein